MTDPRRACCTLAAALAILLPALTVQGRQAEAKKPSLSLRATPPVGFTPLRVRVVADIRDGSDDHAEFYCATVEWDWDDGTVSENSSDCDPYEAGKSTIRRRFTADHIYRQPGQYKITFKLKQKTKQVAASSTSVQVRAGVGDDFGR
ncbi:MAG: hypothetical protein HYX77_07210 [Acidobacteria bacterium]|nr:hypothetical protein [Acidobacteriota bacterium]